MVTSHTSESVGALRVNRALLTERSGQGRLLELTVEKKEASDSKQKMGGGEDASGNTEPAQTMRSGYLLYPEHSSRPARLAPGKGRDTFWRRSLPEKLYVTTHDL